MTGPDDSREWRLGVLDFGTVDRLPGGLPDIIGETLRMTLRGEAETVYATLRRAGFVPESVDLDPDAVLGYLLPVIEPARGRSSPSADRGFAPRRLGSPILALPPTSSAGS